MLAAKLDRIARSSTGVEYWERRARVLGAGAVLNIGWLDRGVDEVTAAQEGQLLPRFTALLDGSERTVLDFGCGTGRFTRKLAQLVEGRALGVDVSETLLAIASRAPSSNVSYAVIRGGVIPLADESMDVVWINVVLGGIVDENELLRAVAEIARVLRPGGLLFLVENTTDRGGARHWSPRPVAVYRQLFPFAIEVIGTLHELDEEVTIFAGRKAAGDSRRLGT